MAAANSTQVQDATPEGAVIHLDAKNFDSIINDTDRPVLVDFWATWCPPCRMIAPAVEQVAAGTSGRAIVAKLDVDEAKVIAARFRVQSIPTLVIFKGGREVDRLVGVQSREVMERRLLAAAN